MSKTLKLFAAAGLLAALGACANEPAEEEFVVIDPEPISQEPVYTGKYK
ncbi:hypothetical protein [Marivita sp. GX14005]|nr:hypothetical protein [Marivita sp. GX14005]MCL3883687.1 hypothetical protein [Marivita sp. GX14005]